MSDITKDASFVIRNLRNILATDYWEEDLHPRDEGGKFTSGSGAGGAGEKEAKSTGENKEEESKRKYTAKEQAKYEKVKEVVDKKNEALDNNDREGFLKALKECHNTEGYDTRDFVEWREQEHPGEISGTKEIERDDKASAILTSLSPNELRDLYPYCEGRSDEELKGYFDTQDVWDTPSNMTDEQYGQVAYRGYAMKAGCSWDPVEKLEAPLTEKEIVNKLGFKDQEGYCGSLAQAYLLNKAGYDVQDGKDEESREFFSRTSSRLEDFAHMDETHGNLTPAQVSSFLKDKIQPGSEYYVAAYAHAAVVRKNSSGNLEFLEAQSYRWNNGWQPLTETRLGKRFGYDPDDWPYTHVRVVNGRELTSNSAYIKQAGYLNNPTNMKGGGISQGASNKREIANYNEAKAKEMRSAREARAAKKTQ